MRVAWLVFAIGCVPDRPIAEVNEACLEAMGPAMYRHACQHGRLGPYSSIDSVAVATRGLPTVDSAQRVLEVTLPPRELDADGTSYVRYVATRSGQHAVFAGAEGRPVPLALLHGAQQLPVTPIEPVPSTMVCGGMHDVTGVVLELGEEYVIAIGPIDAAEVRLFVEHLPTFGEQWSERCVD